ncbi:MAG: flagellar motor switch phosphatase FliY [Oscillospiraceae bacterium]|nr:flagellar motor switch phosphatase FliY [Oscillospiraceae bacterium]
MGDKILSPEEVAALFNNENSGGDSAGSADVFDFSPMDLDILGEVYNISMGSAANAVSSLLRMKVEITAPVVTNISKEELIYQSLEPAVGVEIKYVAGVEGINVFILSQIDVMKIVDIWMGGNGKIDEKAEFNDMHMSAIGELMNQMMGSSSMALAGVLNTQIDISSPYTYKIEGDFSPANVAMNGQIIATRFKFLVGDIINSEMITTCSVDFAKSMIDMATKSFGEADGSNAKVQEIVAGVAGSNQSKQPGQGSQPKGQNPAQQGKTASYGQNGGNNAAYSQNVHQSPQEMQSVNFANFDSNAEFGGAYGGNMDLVLDLPLDVTVEIGRTKKAVHDVLEFGEGSIIELDKQAAEPVDIFVNGNLVARGSVVVIEENFGVRITEIVSNQDKLKAAKNK